MSGTGGFQTQVFDQPSQAVAGDFASNNQWMSYLAGPGGLVAAAGGCNIGVFAWVTPPLDANGTPTQASNSGVGAPDGFVHRAQQGLITQYLAFAGQLIQQGFQMGLMIEGDFWVVNAGTTEALIGQKAYANSVGGAVTFAATASPTTGASATGSTIATEASSFTGSIANNILTVTNVASGTIYPGTTISGGAIASGTKIVSQISGTPNGVGTYFVSIPEQTIASLLITGAYGLLTVGTLTTTPVFQVDDQLAATGSVVAGTKITASVTGAGGTGATMVVDNSTAVGTPQVISAVSNVETKWVARSTGLPGELVKISSWPTG